MLKLVDVCKEYHFYGNGNVRHALSGISAEFRKCGLVALTGPTGCGKTTLLNIIGGIERPSAGEAVLYNKAIGCACESNVNIAYIQRDFRLLPDWTIAENMRVAMEFACIPKKEHDKRLKEALSFVGLPDASKRKPGTLSLLEQRQAVIALFLLCDPVILLVDEPTGSLNFEDSYRTMRLLKEVSKERLVMIATDNIELVRQFADRIVTLADGRMESDTQPVMLNTIHSSGREATRPVCRKASLSLSRSFRLALYSLCNSPIRNTLTVLSETAGLVGLAFIPQCFGLGRTQSSFAYAVLLLALSGIVMGFSACFTVQRRRRDFSVLRAMGASDNVADTLVLLESLMIGCVSGTISAMTAAITHLGNGELAAALLATSVILAWTASRLAMLLLSRVRRRGSR